MVYTLRTCKHHRGNFRLKLCNHRFRNMVLPYVQSHPILLHVCVGTCIFFSSIYHCLGTQNILVHWQMGEVYALSFLISPPIHWRCCVGTCNFFSSIYHYLGTQNILVLWQMEEVCVLSFLIGHKRCCLLSCQISFVYNHV